jgi:predicted dehydrogenase
MSRTERVRPPIRRIALPGNDTALQIVVVASYDDHLAAQRHVFSEKPMCITEADAAAIRKALADAPGLRLSSNTILRVWPRFLNLRHKILSGSMGKLFYAEGDYNYGRLHKLSQGWRGRIPHYSVMLGGGVHMVDLLVVANRQHGG